MSSPTTPNGIYRRGKDSFSPNGKIIRENSENTPSERLLKVLKHYSATASGPHLRGFERAIEKYEEGRISLGRAAELSNVSYSAMIEKLKEKGIKIRFGPEDIEEAEKEQEIIRKLRKSD